MKLLWVPGNYIFNVTSFWLDLDTVDEDSGFSAIWGSIKDISHNFLFLLQQFHQTGSE